MSTRELSITTNGTEYGTEIRFEGRRVRGISGIDLSAYNGDPWTATLKVECPLFSGSIQLKNTEVVLDDMSWTIIKSMPDEILQQYIRLLIDELNERRENSDGI